jgi:predicted nucleic acid-binding protein
VLAHLYTRVLAPNTVVEEMRQAGTPPSVRSWISQPPDWLDVRPDTPSDATLSFLDPGESAAISLALSLHAERILIDDWGRTRRGRAPGSASYRHLDLGVLVLAHQRELLDFETARPINNRPAG